jgi:hypothetical protein
LRRFGLEFMAEGLSKGGIQIKNKSFLNVLCVLSNDPEQSRGKAKRARNYYRSCFKIVDQVQDQGGTNCSTAGIEVIFRGLNDLSQHRDWALDAILKQLLLTYPHSMVIAGEDSITDSVPKKSLNADPRPPDRPSPHPDKLLIYSPKINKTISSLITCYSSLFSEEYPMFKASYEDLK